MIFTLGAMFFVAGWLTEDGWPAILLGVILMVIGAIQWVMG